MIVILLGPPGAGKGTQASALVKRFGFPHISTGDIFRANLEAGTPLGLEAKEYMAQGYLVPDDLVLRLVADRLGKPDVVKSGALLDGFPRTAAQAEALTVFLQAQNSKVDACLLLEVPDAELLKRLSGRRVCRICGAGWHMTNSPPPADLKCPKCGGEIYQRSDDSEATIQKRLAVYHEQTSPLSEYYRQKGSLKVVDGLGAPAEVEAKIVEALS
ncbi:MAG: adenylate kinase [Deltaproteobacteria bacterium]|jgi:adenylate kinase|nr:adenylate kinase [Deltaproteobacteria bacterium]